MTHATLLVLSGALVTAYGTIGLFFLKAWRRTREGLFMWFSISFFILAVQRLTISLGGDWAESASWIYGMRLVAFLLILAAIVQANVGHPRR